MADPPVYEGGSMAIHVLGDSFSVVPTGPVDSEPVYTGQGPAIMATDKSPANFDLSVMPFPPGVPGVTYYEGRSPAIHVFGEEGSEPPPPPGSCITVTETWIQAAGVAGRMPPYQMNVPGAPINMLTFIVGTSAAAISGSSVSFESMMDRASQLFASGGHFIQPPTPPGALAVYGTFQDVLLDASITPNFIAFYRPPEFGAVVDQSEQHGYEIASMQFNDEVADPNEFRLVVNIGLQATHERPLTYAGEHPTDPYSYAVKSTGNLVLTFSDGTYPVTFAFGMTVVELETGLRDGPHNDPTYTLSSASVSAVYNPGGTTEASYLVSSFNPVGGIVAGNVVIDRSLSRGTIRFYLPGIGWYETAITQDLTGYSLVGLSAEHVFIRLHGFGQEANASTTTFELIAPHFCGTSVVPVDDEGVPGDAVGTVTFRRQIGDPTTSLDAHICMLESGAMALEWHTHGAVSVWGGELVPYCGRDPSLIATSGTSLDNVAQAWLHWGQTFDNRAGRPWSDLLARLGEAKAVVLGGVYSAMDAAYKCSSFAGGHAIILLPYFSGDRILVGDPICYNFKWVPQSVLQTYAEAQGIDFYGVTTPQKLYFGCTRAWAA